MKYRWQQFSFASTNNSRVSTPLPSQLGMKSASGRGWRGMGGCRFQGRTNCRWQRHEDGEKSLVPIVHFISPQHWRLVPPPWDEETRLCLRHRTAARCSQPALPSEILLPNRTDILFQRDKRTSQQLCRCGDLVSTGLSYLPPFSFGLCLNPGRSPWLPRSYLCYMQRVWTQSCRSVKASFTANAGGKIPTELSCGDEHACVPL